MPVTSTTEDILVLGRQSSTLTLVNPVNTVGIMGKGLALALREELGEEYFDAYQEDCRTGRLRIGRLTVWRSWCHFWVRNFPTKQHWQGPSRLEYIEAGLGQFAQAYAFAGITGVVFPKLGYWERSPELERCLPAHEAVPGCAPLSCNNLWQGRRSAVLMPMPSWQCTLPGKGCVSDQDENHERSDCSTCEERNMAAMQLNTRTERYEGFTDDGHFVTVTKSRFLKARKYYRKEEAAQLLDPAYWLRRAVDFILEVTVWAPRSFTAVKARIGTEQGQVLYTVQPPLALSDKLIPQAFVRPTPLGYGIQLVFPGTASILRGHLQDAATLFSLLHTLGIGSLEYWEVARTHISGVPMPPYRVFREEFPAHLTGKAAAVIGEMLCASLVSAARSFQRDGAVAEEQPAKGFTQRFKSVARQIGVGFIQEHATSLVGWQGSVYPPRTVPEGSDLAGMVEAALWQHLYEEWSDGTPDEARCVALGNYLCNILFQLVCPDVFVPLALPLQEEGESGKSEEL